jgi:hypothetical protein
MTGSALDVPNGPKAPLADVGRAIPFVRLVALLTGVLGGVGALLLFVAAVDAGPTGDGRPAAGMGLAVIAGTIALCTVLLVLAGWVETWQAARDAGDRPEG